MKKLFFFATVALTVLVVSCQKKEVVADAVKLTSEATANVPVEGGVVTINFSANVAWTAKSSQEWLTLSPAKGDAGEKLTIKASAVKNEATDSRTAEVTITAGTASAKVTVTQGQKDALDVKTTEFVVASEGGVVEVPVSANVEYEVDIPKAVDWIHVTEPNAKGMVDSKVYLEVDETTLYSEEWAKDQDAESIVRSATVTIKAGGLSKAVTIDQKTACPYFDFEGDYSAIQYGGRMTIPQEGGTFTLEVASNLEWRAHYDEEWPPEDTSWLEFKQEEGSIVITVAANESYIARDNWIYVNAGEDIYGDVFGGYFQVYQEPIPAPLTPQMEWSISFPEAIASGYNRLAYTEGGALLVSDGTKIHALNPADGSYLQEVPLSGLTPTSICNDDAGNIIVAANVEAAMNWDTGELTSGQTLTVYCAKDLSETPKVIELPNALYGTLGGFRARGDLATKGSITGVAGGASYWFGYDIANYAPVANSYGTQNSGNHAGPDYFWTPETGAAISYGADLHDGVLMRAYDGDAGGQRVHFRADAYTPQWAAEEAGIPYEKWTEITTAGAGGNENQNNMDVIDYKGKKILAFTQGYHFSWAGFNADIYVLDITDVKDPQVLATIKTADWITEEWPNGQNSADILLHATDNGVELFAVHSGLATIAKFLFDVAAE